MSNYKTGLVIDGVDLDELQDTLNLIRPNVIKFVRSKIEQATNLVAEIVEIKFDEDEPEDSADQKIKNVREKLQMVFDSLNIARFASNVVGFQFYLNFSEEGYCHEDALSYILDVDDTDDLVMFHKNITDLFDAVLSLVDEMESDSRFWHSSRC